MYRKDIDYYCVMHVTGSGLFSQTKGRPDSETRQKLKCSDFLNEKILELQKDFSLHDNTKMLVMLSISTNRMNRYVSMYPNVWFIDCTSGESVYSNTYVSIRIY
jgi:hypothetical protein